MIEEVITVPEMARRLKLNKQQAYDLVRTPGFPLLNFGGERQNRVIWSDVLQWLRKNKSGDAA
ncbi:helix-turn-helix transcriptional regulator [Paenibacillus silvisoli]|uniref:helix-turn-helix transcriptional regulator n=1 Tax=Paenibacillus silvisoli TaxID=3110539 RepID=UPI002803C154|nr:hypothetical protein [Paenibacillus silvisoli]